MNFTSLDANLEGKTESQDKLSRHQLPWRPPKKREVLQNSSFYVGWAEDDFFSTKNPNFESQVWFRLVRDLDI